MVQTKEKLNNKTLSFYDNQQPSLSSNALEGSETSISSPNYGFVKAMIMGDGSLMRVKNRNNLQLQLKHCEDQLSYLNWKKDLLIKSNLFNNRKVPPVRLAEKGSRRVVHKRMANCQDSYRWRTMVSQPIFNSLYQRLYKDGKRQLDPTLFYELDELGLAIYHQDQGSLGFIPSSTTDRLSPNVVWATCQFEEVNQQIADVLFDKFGLCFHSHPDKSGRYILRLQTRDVNKFFGMISKYIAPGMENKFIVDKNATSAEHPVNKLDDDIVRSYRKL